MAGDFQALEPNRAATPQHRMGRHAPLVQGNRRRSDRDASFRAMTGRSLRAFESIQYKDDISSMDRRLRPAQKVETAIRGFRWGGPPFRHLDCLPGKASRSVWAGTLSFLTGGLRV